MREVTRQPAGRQHRKIVPRYIADSGFEAGRRYAERDVNSAFDRCNADHPTLRRHIVDFGIMRRSNAGEYWSA